MNEIGNHIKQNKPDTDKNNVSKNDDKVERLLLVEKWKKIRGRENNMRG